MGVTTQAKQIVLQASPHPGVPDDEVWTHTVVVGAWPSYTTIAKDRMRAGNPVRVHGVLLGHWPYVRFRVRNGHAIYRLGTCERGFFGATLLDCVLFE